MENEAQSAAPPKLKRRWMQFSISAMLLLTLVIAVGLGVTRSRAERQRRAVAFVEGLGGEVYYDGDFAEEADSKGIRARDWLRRWLGRDWFESVVEIDLYETQVSDEGLKHLKELKALKELALDETQVSDAGLMHLKELTALEILSVYKTRVTDAGIAELQGALPDCLIFY